MFYYDKKLSFDRKTSYKNPNFSMSTTDSKMSNNDASYLIYIAIHQMCSPEWVWECPDASILSGMLIWLVEGGEATLESRHGTLTVHRGDFLLMPATPQDFYIGRHDPRLPLDVSWIHLFPSEDAANTIPAKLLEGIRFHQTLSDPSFAVKLMRRIISSSGTGRNTWMQVLLQEVAEDARTCSHDISPQEKLVESLCRQITENPTRYRTLADLPPLHACSRDHLIRLFKKHCGVTPGEFMIRTRIDHAKQLLKIPGTSVKQVALDLGYPDPYAFSKQFKARTGTAPGRFRTSDRL